MPTYEFRCQNTKNIFERDLSFKEFDKFKAGELTIICSICPSCKPEQIMPTGVSVYNATPRTLGSLADRNTKYRLPIYEMEEEKKREKKKAAGKFVPPKEIYVPWERPEVKIDMKERKAKKEEYLAKSKSRKRSSRN